MELDEESETFVIHITALNTSLTGMTIFFSQEARISALIQDQASTKVLPKYADYTDMFSFILTIELLENTSINKNIIKLEEGKQSLNSSIYSLGPLELETLKTYIEIRLKTRFI